MGIKDSLRDCLFGCNHPGHVKRLAETCHSIGLAFLRMKAASNRLYLFHGEKLEDLAWDFIADLFETGQDGRLAVFCEYFDRNLLEELNNDDLLIELRKLVFTKVEDNIFKAIGDSDPSLKKIIRNIKLAVRSSDCKHSVCCVNGQLVIEQNPGSRLPVMPSDIMQIHLSSRMRDKMQIPEIIAEVIDILTDQDEYQKKFSLTGLSLIIREIYVNFNQELFRTHSEPAAEMNLMNGEFDHFLEKSVNKIRLKIGQKYVRSKKIPLHVVNAYINAACTIVKDVYGNTAGGETQYDVLKVEMPGLSYQQFREKHRQILEYLVKQIKSDLITTYKQEWF